MKITIITLFPKMISGFFDESIIKRAQEKGLVEIEVINPREFAEDNYKTVDDKPYGGGVGMVMKVEPIYKSLEKVNALEKNDQKKVVYMSPKGKIFDQKKAKKYSKLEHLVLLAGHYEGIDERILDFVDEEISMGDFVMTGGEIAISAIVDSVVRLLPGVLKQQDATEIESFFEIELSVIKKIIGEIDLLKNLEVEGVKKVRLLEYPQYTRPENFMDKKVPEVLLSGNHKDIEEWRIKQAFEETVNKRPDLLIEESLESNSCSCGGNCGCS